MTEDGKHDEDAQVVDLTRGHAPLRDREITRFIDYWTTMRRDGDVPLRAEIDPRGIESLLSNAFVAEKIAPGLARLRIAGAYLSDLMGMEVRGMPVSAIIEPDWRDRLSDAVVELFDRPAMVQIGLASDGGIGRPALTGTLVLLPLRSDLGDISRALGCLVAHGAIGRTPRRFSITGIRVKPVELDDGQPVRPRRTAPPRPTGFGEAGERIRYEHPHPGDSERPYLRLVKTD